MWENRHFCENVVEELPRLGDGRWDACVDAPPQKNSMYTHAQRSVCVCSAYSHINMLKGVNHESCLHTRSHITASRSFRKAFPLRTWKKPSRFARGDILLWKGWEANSFRNSSSVGRQSADRRKGHLLQFAINGRTEKGSIFLSNFSTYLIFSFSWLIFSLFFFFLNPDILTDYFTHRIFVLHFSRVGDVYLWFLHLNDNKTGINHPGGHSTAVIPGSLPEADMHRPRLSSVPLFSWACLRGPRGCGVSKAVNHLWSNMKL